MTFEYPAEVVYERVASQKRVLVRLVELQQRSDVLTRIENLAFNASLTLEFADGWWDASVMYEGKWWSTRSLDLEKALEELHGIALPAADGTLT